MHAVHHTLNCFQATCCTTLRPNFHWAPSDFHAVFLACRRLDHAILPQSKLAISDGVAPGSSSKCFSFHTIRSTSQSRHRQLEQSLGKHCQHVRRLHQEHHTGQEFSWTGISHSHVSHQAASLQCLLAQKDSCSSQRSLATDLAVDVMAGTER